MQFSKLKLFCRASLTFEFDGNETLWEPSQRRFQPIFQAASEASDLLGNAIYGTKLKKITLVVPTHALFHIKRSFSLCSLIHTLLGHSLLIWDVIKQHLFVQRFVNYYDY